ncbi:RHS repeat-associated core domain-containing protein [Pseudomonas sp. zfem002]|uniref:RHS repeat-associated core domain-containing protein n=1 Tax=Pseudomonas sp. zfem002 TaxID=3078197 RepID=UPI00292996E1|nr:RHS repeat-associated core domain-containing protein [Pseudomonas sp. zfem002]MDU9392471.1 RHS repeat-associated core domain-containing protein [Pseudomonas sp. zfem002]
MSNDRLVLLACTPHQSPLRAVAGGQPQDIVHGPYGHRRETPGLPGSGFNGQWREPETGWYLLGNGYRAYNPVLMRFHQPDSWSPFGGGGLNPYVYCLGDPINHRDPTGHMAWFGALGLEALGGMATRAPAGAAEGGSAEASPWLWISIILGVAAVGAIAGIGAGLKDKFKGLPSRRPYSPPLDRSTPRHSPAPRESVIRFAPRPPSPSVSSMSAQAPAPVTPVALNSMPSTSSRGAPMSASEYMKQRQARHAEKMKSAIHDLDGSRFLKFYRKKGNKVQGRILLRDEMSSSLLRPAKRARGMTVPDLEKIAIRGTPSEAAFAETVLTEYQRW